MSSTDGGRWLPLAEAAQMLGLRPETVRKQVKRGRRRGRYDNYGRWEVYVEVGTSSTMPDDAVSHGPAPVLDVAALLGERDARLARLEGDVADLRAERDRLLAVIERLAAERRPEPERRSWLGLRAWWRRLIEGEG